MKGKFIANFIVLVISLNWCVVQAATVNKWIRQLFCHGAPSVKDQDQPGSDKQTPTCPGSRYSSPKPSFTVQQQTSPTIYSETPFKLPQRDSDKFFRDSASFVCDKFENWFGYSKTQIQSMSKSLPITDHSPWHHWDKDSDYVFLGYRGTEKYWVETAARDQYRINPKGQKAYGDGIYMTPHPSVAMMYGGYANARICYNFAPQKALRHLLQCAMVTTPRYGSTGTSLSPPQEESARFAPLSTDACTLVSQAVYPRSFLPYIRILCIQKPQISSNSDPEITRLIPGLFRYNNPYYDVQTRKMRLSQPDC